MYYISSGCSIPFTLYPYPLLDNFKLYTTYPPLYYILPTTYYILHTLPKVQ